MTTKAKNPKKKRHKPRTSDLETHKPDTSLRKKVENLWALGYSKVAISRQMGIHDQTLEKHYKMQMRPEVHGKDATALGRQVIIDRCKDRKSIAAARILLKLGGELRDDFANVQMPWPGIVQQYVILPDGTKVTKEQYQALNQEESEDDPYSKP